VRQATSNTRSLGKRDAVAFVRAVRRYGLRSRLADVASEAGGAVEAAGRQAQELLWEELVQGCRQALERAAEQDKQQGTLHDPRVSSAQ
jgi:chromodomain-helicase-DNA-binding protein 1